MKHKIQFAPMNKTACKRNGNTQDFEIAGNYDCIAAAGFIALAS
jgi:hypothetical protein